MLYPVCLHYLIFDRAAVRATLAYVRRRFPGHGRLRRLADIYRLFVSQGRSLIDRYCLLTGQDRFDIRLEGAGRLDKLLESGSGFILLTAHLGNWQAVMFSLRCFRRKVNLVLRPDDNPAVAETLRLDAGGNEISIISPESSLGGSIPIIEALRRGEIVSIMGDRSYGYNAVTVNFLGDPARLACGGFHIAAVARCPIAILTSAKISTSAYLINVAAVFHPRYLPGRGKREQLRDWVGDFARLMEAYTESYPYQCFLFYDVWREAEQAGPDGARPGSPPASAGRPGREL